MTLRRALVFGGSGLVGRAVIDQLLANPLYLSVTALVRRPIPEYNPRLTQRGLDFDFLPSQTLGEIDDVYCCLGTTIRAAGSRDAFHKVDYQYVLIAATAGLRSGAKRFALVTAAGANARSRVFYNRVKGEVEGEMMQMGYGSLIIARPSFLIGDRAALKQPNRPGEGWALRLLRPLAPLLPKRVRPIPAVCVARALTMTVTSTDVPVRILESDELLRLGEGRYW
jgi:uncharacterized protein YbjT (DUF2867 family)